MAMDEADRAEWRVVAKPEGSDPSSLGRLLDRWLSFGVSGVLHAAIGLLLALVMLVSVDDETMVVTMSEPDPEPQLLEMPEFQLDVVKLPKAKLHNLVAAPPAPNLPQTSAPSDAGLVPSFDAPEELFPRLGGDGDGMFGGTGRLGGEFTRRLKIVRAKSGDVQISLLWHNYNDLDLHVRCPSGEVVSYKDRNSRCGGELDVDMNVRRRHSRKPVENIYWPRGAAPKGKFQVAVNLFSNHGDGDPSKFIVRVLRDGKEEFHYGIVSLRQTWAAVCEFRRR